MYSDIINNGSCSIGTIRWETMDLQNVSIHFKKHKYKRKLNLRSKPTLCFSSNKLRWRKMSWKFSDQDESGVYKKCCGTYLKSHILQLEQGYVIYSSIINPHIQSNLMLHVLEYNIIFHLDRGHYINYIHHTIHRCVDAEHSALFLTQRWWKYWQRLSTICLTGSHLYVLVYIWVFSKYLYITIHGTSDFVLYKSLKHISNTCILLYVNFIADTIDCIPE